MASGSAKAAGSEYTGKESFIDKFSSEVDDEGNKIPWIKTDTAESVFGGLILLNAVVLGIDIEVGLQNIGGIVKAILMWIQVVFLLVFVVELVLRIKADGKQFVFNLSGLFDAFIILVSVVEYVLTAVKMLSGGTGESPLAAVSVMRIFRLLRIARIVRVLHIFPELALLVHGLAASMQAVFWVLCLLVVIMYIGSLICAMELGHEVDDPDLIEFFGSVGSSFYTHFMIVTLEGYPEVAASAGNQSWIWYLYVCFFIVFSSMVLMNLVTGIVCESVVDSARNDELASHVYDAESAKFKEVLEELIRSQGYIPEATHSFKPGEMGVACDDNGLVQEVSVNGPAYTKGIKKGDQCLKVGTEAYSTDALVRAEKSGSDYEITVSQEITLKEFKKLIEDPSIRETINTLDICLEIDDEDLFQIIDEDGNETLNCKEVFSGLLRLRGSKEKSHSLLVQSDLVRHTKRVRERLSEAEQKINEYARALCGKLQDRLSSHIKSLGVEIASTAQKMHVQQAEVLNLGAEVLDSATLKLTVTNSGGEVVAELREGLSTTFREVLSALQDEFSGRHFRVLLSDGASIENRLETSLNDAFGITHQVRSGLVRLNPKQMNELPVELSQTAMNRLREVFDRCDKNHDEKISKIELIKICREDAEIADFFQLPQRIRQEDGSRDAMEETFQSMDVSDDRSVTWEEFLKFYGAFRRNTTSALKGSPQRIANSSYKFPKHTAASQSEESARYLPCKAPWSVTQRIRLSGQAEKDLLTGHVRLLHSPLSVGDAVHGLNAGDVKCEEGCCIVYSKSSHSYFLLYHENCQSVVRELLIRASQSSKKTDATSAGVFCGSVLSATQEAAVEQASHVASWQEVLRCPPCVQELLEAAESSVAQTREVLAELGIELEASRIRVRHLEEQLRTRDEAVQTDVHHSEIAVPRDRESRESGPCWVEDHENQLASPPPLENGRSRSASPPGVISTPRRKRQSSPSPGRSSARRFRDEVETKGQLERDAADPLSPRHLEARRRLLGKWEDHTSASSYSKQLGLQLAFDNSGSDAEIRTPGRYARGASGRPVRSPLAMPQRLKQLATSGTFEKSTR